jgi:uncharacterized Ntn-hydrolase superfamily protein
MRPFYPFAHTFSIVARDPVTGDLGVAVQSHWFSVGSVVTWAEAGVGAIATQALAEVSYGPLGLDLLRGGKKAGQALKALLTTDEGSELRQVAMVDASGDVATHTGDRCIKEAGHLTGKGFSVQANMMLNNTVWQAMFDAYQTALQNPALDLPERILLALEAAQNSGGDIRGKQSAAIKIVSGKPSPKSWAGVLMELRVEDNPEPLAELRRLVDIHRAYEFMNKGDEFLGKGKKKNAMQAYASAVRLAPQIVEVPFWNAVTLADNGHLEEALPIFKDVFTREPIWKELLSRLPVAGLIKDDLEMLDKIYQVV